MMIANPPDRTPSVNVPEPTHGIVRLLCGSTAHVRHNSGVSGSPGRGMKPVKALGAGSRRFKSSHPDQPNVLSWSPNSRASTSRFLGLRGPAAVPESFRRGRASRRPARAELLADPEV